MQFPSFVFSVVSMKGVDKYVRSTIRMELDLAPGETRGYWKYYPLGKWSKQSKALSKITKEKYTLLFDSSSRVLNIDKIFARKVGCRIDRSQTQDSVRIG